MVESAAPSPPGAAPQPPRSGALEVLRIFLRLGLTSFGGPVAHLGYFRQEFVERRHWLDERAYADLVALCQFLPGPASSQVGIALGLQRAGVLGALAAWLGFTLPSAVALILFACGVAESAALAASGAVHGLKVVAVAVVAQAVWGMARSLCPDRLRAGIAFAAALLVLAVPTTAGQVGAIVLGGLVGRWALRLAPSAPTAPAHPGLGRRAGAVLLGVFALLLVGLPLLAAAWPATGLAAVAAFYQAGALVFGGGHVVLPLLQAGVVPPGWVSHDAFLAGYGAAQAVPGPLFSFAAYLGTLMPPPLGGWPGGLGLLAAIFLPGALLVLGALPFWEAMRRRPGMQRTLGGLNAAVVGILGAALYDPVWTSAIHSKADFALALAAFGLLLHARLSPVWVVALAVLAGTLLPG
ncbi:MAG: chromate efflux transporter [Burkholderiaceae bacterium]|nr:chromate efflux transporter [Burkholderiaceae bacterium]